jgi:hypothetical protein
VLCRAGSPGLVWEGVRMDATRADGGSAELRAAAAAAIAEDALLIVAAHLVRNESALAGTREGDVLAAVRDRLVGLLQVLSPDGGPPAGWDPLGQAVVDAATALRRDVSWLARAPEPLPPAWAAFAAAVDALPERGA